MTIYRFFSAVLTLILLCFSGCATLKQPLPADQAPFKSISVSAEDFQRPPNAYYYYMMANLAVRDGRMQQAARYLEKAIDAGTEGVFLKKELALIYLEQKKKQEALDLAQEILAQDPDNVEALIVSASIRQSMGKHEGVKQTYEKVIEKAPDRENIYLILARLYLQDEQFEEAANVLNRFVERFPDNYTAYYYLAKSYAGMGKMQEAIDAYEKTLMIEPGLIEPRAELIKIYSDKGQKDKVISLYEEIIAQYPENVPAAIELGLIYHENGREEAAREIFVELGKRQASGADVVKTLIQQLLGQKRYEEALTALSGMLEGAPHDPGLQYLAGAAHYLMKHHEEALTHFQKVEPASDFYPDAMIHQAIINNKMGHPEKGVALLEDAMDRVDDAAKVNLIPYLSAFYQEQGQLEDAAALLKKGLSIDPENTELHYELGVLYDKMGDNEAAVEKMKTVIKMDAENADALNYLGYTYADKGIKLDEAESLIKKALEIKPDNGYILDSLGWVYYQKQDYEKALTYLERAVEKVPDDPIVLEHVGDAYLKLGQPQKALEFYQRSLENEPKSEEAILDKIRSIQQEEPTP